MNTKKTIEQEIAAELQPKSKTFKHALALHERFAEAAAAHGANSPEARAAAARYGAFVSRTWRQYLVLVLTRACIEMAGAGPRATRERIRSWQVEVFGRAVARSALHEFAQEGPGARGAPLEIKEVVAAWAAQVYEQNASRLSAKCAALTGKARD